MILIWLLLIIQRAEQWIHMIIKEDSWPGIAYERVKCESFPLYVTVFFVMYRELKISSTADCGIWKWTLA